jgi:hypothetical protein
VPRRHRFQVRQGPEDAVAGRIDLDGVPKRDHEPLLLFFFREQKALRECDLSDFEIERINDTVGNLDTLQIGYCNRLTALY